MSDDLIIKIISLVLLAFILMLMLCYSIYHFNSKDMAENKENFNLGETVAFSVIITAPTIFMIVFMDRINILLK